MIEAPFGATRSESKSSVNSMGRSSRSDVAPSTNDLGTALCGARKPWARSVTRSDCRPMKEGPMNGSRYLSALSSMLGSKAHQECGHVPDLIFRERRVGHAARPTHAHMRFGQELAYRSLGRPRPVGDRAKARRWRTKDWHRLLVWRDDMACRAHLKRQNAPNTDIRCRR